MIADLLTDVEDFAQDQQGLAKVAKLKAAMAKVDVRPSVEVESVEGRLLE